MKIKKIDGLWYYWSTSERWMYLPTEVREFIADLDSAIGALISVTDLNKVEMFNNDIINLSCNSLEWNIRCCNCGYYIYIGSSYSNDS